MCNLGHVQYFLRISKACMAAALLAHGPRFRRHLHFIARLGSKLGHNSFKCPAQVWGLKTNPSISIPEICPPCLSRLHKHRRRLYCSWPSYDSPMPHAVPDSGWGGHRHGHRRSLQGCMGHTPEPLKWLRLHSLSTLQDDTSTRLLYGLYPIQRHGATALQLRPSPEQLKNRNIIWGVGWIAITKWIKMESCLFSYFSMEFGHERFASKWTFSIVFVYSMMDDGSENFRWHAIH